MRARIVALNAGAEQELLNGLAAVVAGHPDRFEPLETHAVCLGSPPDSLPLSLLAPHSKSPLPCVVLCLPEHGLSQAAAYFDLLRALPQSPQVICLVPGGSPAALSQLWTLGARDLLLPPVRALDWGTRLLRIGHPLTDAAPTTKPRHRHPALDQIIGESKVWRAAFDKIPSVAQWNVSVLIRGETGTGKELCARAIHYLSPRAGGPFVAINCGAVPLDLVENELFGHDRGAFTGASQASTGLVQEAEGGTLFFDEVDALPAGAQVKLLRLLQNKTYRRLGSTREHHADIRVIAATNTDLRHAVREQRFREDLYYRINVFELMLPPLRQRAEDIRLLAAHFLERFAAEQRLPVCHLTPQALETLEAQPWPGNIRELENVLQRALILANGAPLRLEHLDLPALPPPPSTPDSSFQMLKRESVALFERKLLARLLAEHNGNITHAARAAKKNRRAFWQLLKKHGLQGTDPRCRPAARRPAPHLSH